VGSVPDWEADRSDKNSLFQLHLEKTKIENKKGGGMHPDW